MVYAIVSNGKVINLVESESALEKTWVDVSAFGGTPIIGGGYSKKNGFSPPVDATPAVVESDDNYRAKQVNTIRDITSQTVANLKANAAKYEIDTWGTQYNDYSNWLRLPESPTPFVDNLAKTRGLSREDLFKKIEHKVMTISGLQGVQHAFEDKLKTAATKDEMDSVVAEFKKTQQT